MKSINRLGSYNILLPREDNFLHPLYLISWNKAVYFRLIRDFKGVLDSIFLFLSLLELFQAHSDVQGIESRDSCFKSIKDVLTIL